MHPFIATSKRSFTVKAIPLVLLVASLVATCQSKYVFEKCETPTSSREDAYVETEANIANTTAFLCYWGNWAYYRHEWNDEQKKDLQFLANNVDVSMCTHLIYSFAGLNSQNNMIHTLDPTLDLTPDEVERNTEDGIPVAGVHGMMRQAVSLKSQNPNLKVLIAIGGWEQGSARFSKMAACMRCRNNFINSVLTFLEEQNFDGLDLDWEYPGARDGAPGDKENFVTLIHELRCAFDKKEEDLGRYLMLTAALGAGPATVEAGYNVTGISEHLDFLNIMAYDLKVYVQGQWEKIGHHSPLHPKASESPEDQALSVSAVIDNYIALGAPRKKLALGVGAYGKTYTMASPNQFNFYDPVAGPGPQYGFSKEAGTIFFSEICYYIAKAANGLEGWRMGFDNEYRVPFAHDGSTWIGYDDEQSIREKVDYAESMGLGGMMIWSIDQDDFRNDCGGWYRNTIGGTVRRRMDYHNSTRLTSHQE